MKKEPIKMCTICRVSHHRNIKNVKNAFLENRSNIPASISHEDKKILEDYSFKNVIKKPEHVGRIARMILPKSSLWQPGRKIKISFVGGKKKINEKVKAFAKEWLQFANLEFKFITDPEDATIRITFKPSQGSWSAVGTDNLSFDTNEATMNFGWLEHPSTTEAEFRGVVLHEFGHMIGCGHEHESPKNGGVPWLKKNAYDYYMSTQGWNKEEVDEQVFDVYSKNQIIGTTLDKKSIMMYAIPNWITKGDFEVGWNYDLSTSDKTFIKKTYPKT